MEQIPNILDLGLAALMAFFGVRALVRGFIREILGLIGLVVAILASAATYEYLAYLLQKVTGVKGEWWSAVAFGLSLAVVYFIFSYLGRGLSRLIQEGPFSMVDRILGCATGVAKGVLLSYLVINAILLVTPFQAPGFLQKSYIAPYVVRTGRAIVDLIPMDITRTLQEKSGLLPRLEQAPKSRLQPKGKESD
jgi:membrane protein required for colicin V production